MNMFSSQLSLATILSFTAALVLDSHLSMSALAFQFSSHKFLSPLSSLHEVSNEQLLNKHFVSRDEFTTKPSSSRRDILQKSASVAFSFLIGETAMSKSASASYSAYTRREEDWKTREKNGEIKYSNARELRSQLREIAPMNSEGSKIFCPNGPSAAVSPLMENKCGVKHCTRTPLDRMALPSVYGRNNDILGNSIPGFGSAGGVSTTNVAQLRDELNAQAYFR
ncbi:hypothetical protein ACHAW6_012003 [Cyclotella cf. meneghiniana]